MRLRSSSAGLRVTLKETFELESVRAFQREFSVLRQLRHDNLPRYFQSRAGAPSPCCSATPVR